MKLGNVPDDWWGPGAPLIVVVGSMVMPLLALIAYLIARAVFDQARVRPAISKWLAWTATLGLWELAFQIARAFGQFDHLTVGATLVVGAGSFVILTLLFIGSNRRQPVATDKITKPLLRSSQ